MTTNRITSLQELLGTLPAAWFGLSIGDSHNFLSNILLRITEHISSTDTVLNIHHNDRKCPYYGSSKNSCIIPVTRTGLRL